MHLPPHFAIATSKESLVLVDGFSKRSASVVFSFRVTLTLPLLRSSAISYILCICSFERSFMLRKFMQTLAKYETESLVSLLSFLFYRVYYLLFHVLRSPLYRSNVLLQ